jgi:hypothetical protein
VKNLVRFGAISALVQALNATTPNPPQSKPASLATVALPTYIDATGSKNYGYLAGSLTDAIDASMQQKFDYARADKTAVERETKKLWRPGRIPLDADVKQIAILTRSDYVIVGSYSLSKNKKKSFSQPAFTLHPTALSLCPRFQTQ